MVGDITTQIRSWEVPNDRTIVIRLENGIEVYLTDDSDEYECLRSP